MKGKLSKPGLNIRSILLPAILFLGLFFRLYNLGGESLWLDEALSIKYAHLNLFQIFFQHKETPPLYYILLHWWIYLFGTSEFSLRLPSAILGCLSVFMLYKMGSRLFDEDVGRLSALLMAFSVFHIQYSQEARTYSLSVLLTLLSMYFFIILLNKMSRKTLIGYVLFSILLIYSHVYGLFIIIAQNIYFIGLSLFPKENRNPDIKTWFLTQLLLIFLFSPWLFIFLIKVYAIQKFGYWIETPHISTIIYSFKTYSSGSMLLLLLYLGLSLFALLSYEKLRGSKDDKILLKSLKGHQWKIRLLNADKIYFLLIWLLSPIILPFVISQFSQPIYQDKYTIVALSAFYLLIARGLSNLPGRTLKSISISIVIMLSLLSIRGYYSEIKKEQWREAAAYIDTNANNEDMVLFNAPNCMEPFNYYSRNGLIIKKGFPENGGNVGEENINKLLETVDHHDRVWIVLSHSVDKKELVTKTLSKSYNLSRHKEYKDVKLYLFDKGYAHTASSLPDLNPKPTTSQNSTRN